ncbi:unnamed protein product [Candida parapsilosis]
MIKISTRSKKRITVYYASVALWALLILTWYHYNYKPENIVNHSIYDIYDDHYGQTPKLNQRPSNPKLSGTSNNKMNSNNPSLPNTATESDPQGEDGEEDDYEFPDFKNTTIYQTLLDDYNISKEIDFHSTVYDSIFEQHSLDSVLGNLNFKQRCDLYFKHIFLNNPNWIFDPNENYNVVWGAPFQVYKKMHKEELEREEESSFENSPDFVEFQRTSYAKWKSHEMDQKIVDNVSVLRLYNKCYVTNDESQQQQSTKRFIKDQKTLIRQIDDEVTQIPKFTPSDQEKRIADVEFSEVFQRRVYPWLSFELPVFERWTGDIPTCRQIIVTYSMIQVNHSNFLKSYKGLCQGKGIVLSIADKHVDDSVSLIHLLRALNNKLPIQIVYFDNLSDDTKRRIVTAAREDFSHLPQSYYKIAHLFPSDYLDPKSKGLPKQEIWFVNTASVINERYKMKFGGFANKLLATFFNSFNEMMIIDADTVMMQNPQEYFKLQGYKDTGTFFFRDRAVIQNRALSDGEFFKKVSQSTVDSLMFDVPLLTDYTLRRDYFRGLLHTMESGMVLINRQLHFNSILMIVHMNFMHPLKRLSYGDKELYWLGSSNWTNDRSTRKITTRWIAPQLSELCSPHPGHINEENNHTLLWINSGFRFCHQAPMVNFAKEVTLGSRLRFLPQTVEAFRTFYYSPLRIKTAIVPPQDPEIHHRWNKQDEPTHGWFMDQHYCQKYLWCGYSVIGGKVSEDEDNTMEGLVIEYSSKERAMFDYLGDIWIGME